ncbi:MAG TPA: exodeoxyribonuclease VII small subunit [Thermomicrobiales bacterium]|jgi:exodeoxyribonuclease VII small subunit|nr:exodeoxyribonuclease VII small subunit [Thermomicrobiales bacterium]
MTESATTAQLLDRCNQLAASDDYEAVRNGLTQVITLLEQPGLGLNDSVRAYEVGRKLAEQCQTLLDAAELRITQLDGAGSDTGTGPLTSRVRLES